MSRIFVACSLALLACSAPHAPAPQPAPPVVAAPPPAPIAPRERPHYTMDVTLVPETHELRVTGSVIVPTAAPHTAVTFKLMDIMTALEVTSTPPGTLSAPSSPAPGGAGNVERTLTLSRPAREVEIRFSYVTRGGPKFVYSIGPESMFAGGHNTAWYPLFSSARSTGEIRYHAPARYKVIAGGAATEAERGGQRTTTVAYAKPSTFSFIAGAYTEHTRPGTVPLRAYVLRDRPGFAAYLDGCSRVLEILVREFGAYPYNGFALVEAPSAATRLAGFDGASFEGYIVTGSDSLDQPFGLAFFGHEIGHQWWGNLVTKEGQAGGHLTGEGLAQYGSLRAVEEIEGAAAAERYRRTGYPGYNDDQNGRGFLRVAAAGIDEPAAVAVEGYRPIVHALANSKGLLALDHVARVMGRERFRDALHDVTRQYAFRSIAWPEFLRIVQSHAARDLAPTFAQWFDRTGAPDWSVEGKPSGRAFRGAIVQRGEPYTLELDVVLSGRGRSISHRVAIDGPRTPIALDAPFDIERIEVDPNFEVLHWTPEYRAHAEALADVTRARAKRSAGDKEAAAALYIAALAKPRGKDPHGVRFRLHFGYSSLLRNREQRAEAKAQLRAAVAERVRPPDLLPWAYLSLAEIAEQDGDRAAAARHARAAIDAEAAAGVPLGAAAVAAALTARTR